MADEKLLTVREVSLLLSISEREVMNLAESGVIPAYKVGGVYLRFKREQVLGYQKSSHPVSSNKAEPLKKSTFQDGVSDFFYFNDFYILAALLVVLLLAILLRG
jgi:excisionase family DNA binding protein